MANLERDGQKVAGRWKSLARPCAIRPNREPARPRLPTGVDGRTVAVLDAGLNVG